MTAENAAKLVAEYLAFIEHAPPPHFFWHAPEGDVLMAAGCARSFDPVDAKDWRQWAVSEAVASSERSVPSDSDAPSDMPFIALVGFAPGGFDHHPNEGGRWSGFPRARFYQPRQALLRRNGEERRWSDGQQHALPRPGEEVQPQSIDVLDWDREGFTSRVRTALAILREGNLEKVVLARQCHVRLQRAADLGQSLRRMLAHPFSFTICHSPDGEQYFFSATPERLGRIDQGRFETMALAGTAAVLDDSRQDSGQVGGGDPASVSASFPQDVPGRLLADAKERAEHAYVVEMIRDAASTFATGTEVQDVRVLELPHMRHMLTQISGQMAPECGMRHLIAALHPTPAVAGTPRAEAMRLIAELEPFDRGLYAGCAGWFVGDGDGDAAVTIRSALLRGTDATLWSGAGIIRDSDAEAEERETRVKLQTMLDVLGA